MIPEAEIKEVKQSSDILGLFRSYGLKLERKGKDWFTSCPFHGDDTPSLSIDPAQNVFHCLGCGEKGNVYQLVQKMEGLTFPEAFDKVAALQGLKPINGTRPANAVPCYTRDELLPVLEAAYKQMRDKFVTGPAAHFYMEEKRGLKYTLHMEVGYCPTDFGRKLGKTEQDKLIALGIMHDRKQVHLAACVVFPLHDVEGRLVGLYGRKIRGNGTHYYLPGPRNGVFSIHDGNSNSVYITESVIDALSLNQIGITSVLALHGVNGFTPVHEQWLAAKGIKTVYLVLDGDRAGREVSDRLSLQLKEKGYTVHNLELPEGEDPNSFFALAAKTFADIKALPGYPKKLSAESCQLTALSNGEYLMKTAKLNYVIKGLTGFGLDRLRVTIKCTVSNVPSQFYIDNLDLYNARGRSAFVEGVCNELKADREGTAADVKQLITLLEKERLAMASGEAENKHPVMSPADREEALKALKDKQLIKNLLTDFEACGMIGEEKAKLLGYIGTVSRLLGNPLGILVISRSGAGKTALQDAVCSFVPEESLIKYTRLTGQALFYKDENSLKNKVLAIEEEEGMEQAIYAIRTLQSSQRLSVATTRSDPKTGKLKTDEYTVEGPVFIMIATTNPNSLDFETKNRFILMTIDETSEQTERILKARRGKYTLEGRLQARNSKDILKKHHNMQRLLRPIEVVNPYAQVLEYPFDRLQMRREFDKYMTLINAIALLHQYQRPVKTINRDGSPFEYIEATVEDIAMANKLVLEFFPYALDELAPHTRKFCYEIRKYIEANGGEVTFTRKQIRDFSGWSDWPVRQALEQLVELGYLNKTGINGTASVYELLCDATEEGRQKLFLTSPSELKARLHELRN